MTEEYYKDITQTGEALIKAIGGLTQIARMHSDNNALLVDAVNKLIGLITRAGQKEDNVTIVQSDGRFYFQGKKLYVRPENKRILNRMMQYLEKRSIFSLHFKSDLKDVSGNEAITFARLIDQADQHAEPTEWLKARFGENGIKWVDINGKAVDQPDDSAPRADDEPDELALKRVQARKQYSQVLGSVKEVSRKLSSNQNVGMRNSVRLVQKMVDIITEDESLFSILSTVRVYDDYTYVHSLNVAILSMCLGKQIGLDHMMLERLGLCGLFHDLGKVEIPRAILNKRGRLDEAEFAEIKTHPVHSARLILKLKARRDRKVKILMAPFEHHMGYNRSGYPQTRDDRSVSLFGRILTIADVYDAITSPRIYRAQTLSPDRALGYMLEQSGTSFDPILLKVFINILGAYPVGTLVKLDTGEMGIVVGRSKGKDGTRPIVQLLIPDAEKKFKKGALVDLSNQPIGSDTKHRNIIESMHPSDMGIQAAEFLMQG
jgi:HD-GYP domain-containing protein (c-di-GMP phosphodiesterase class II)